MTRTLTRDGKLGHYRPYEFIGSDIIVRHLMDTESDVCMTIGLPYRDPTINKADMSWDEAVRWLDRYGGRYKYEAWHDGERLTIYGLSEKDMR